MEIKRIDVKFFQASGLHSQCEGITHIKSLPYLSIVQSVEGSYDIAINHGKFHSTHNNGVFIAPSNAIQTITHHVDKSTNYMTAQWLFLDVVINNTESLDSIFNFPIIMPKEYQDEVNNIISSLNSTQDLCLSLSLVYRMVYILLQIGTPKTETNSLFNEIKNYVALHYMENIDYEIFAKDLYVSKSTLFRTIKKYAGKTPSAFIHEYRISVATDLLFDAKKSIKEIAYIVGFSDEYYFSKIFKSVTTVSPAQYRKIFVQK